VNWLVLMRLNFGKQGSPPRSARARRIAVAIKKKIFAALRLLRSAFQGKVGVTALVMHPFRP